MDNQGGMGGGAQQWGRKDDRLGAFVDDNTRTVFAKGLGWVNDRGAVYKGGQWHEMDGANPEALAMVQPFMQKAKMLGQNGAGPSAPPVADQMRQVQAQAAAPKPVAPPPPPANSTHAEIAKSFRHMANKLTQSSAPGGA